VIGLSLLPPIAFVRSHIQNSSSLNDRRFSSLPPIYMLSAPFSPIVVVFSIVIFATFSTLSIEIPVCATVLLRHTALRLDGFVRANDIATI